ncbi:MAG: hypothetical protein RL748_1537, partial [Pseudomonadota bacterium]
SFKDKKHKPAQTDLAFTADHITYEHQAYKTQPDFQKMQRYKKTRKLH